LKQSNQRLLDDFGGLVIGQPEAAREAEELLAASGMDVLDDPAGGGIGHPNGVRHCRHTLPTLEPTETLQSRPASSRRILRAMLKQVVGRRLVEVDVG